MDKEARNGRIAKKINRKFHLSDRERFYLMLWWSGVSKSKDDFERRRMNTCFDALDIDDIEQENRQGKALSAYSDELTEYELSADTIDYMVTKLKLEVPPHVGLPNYTERVCGKVCERLKDLMNNTYETPEGFEKAAADAPEVTQ